MVKPEDVPLILLYTDRSSAIEGTTRFQKLVFLAQMEENLGDIFEFEPYKYGPYSVELQSVIHSHENKDLIDRHEDITALGNEKNVYSITPDGIQRVQKLLRDNDAEAIFEALQEVKQEFNDWGNRRLLRYVYNKYDEYATESELGDEDLEDPQAELALQQDSIPEDAEDTEDEEPFWETTETPIEDALPLPESLDYYIDLIEDIPKVTNVYFEEWDDEPNRVVVILAERDFGVMDRLYDIELDLKDQYPDEELSFRVTVQDASEPVVSQAAHRIYSRN